MKKNPPATKRTATTSARKQRVYSEDDEILSAHKRGRGQPAYTPTTADRKTVLAMTAAGFTQADIAPCIGREGISEPTLRKHFEHELAVGVSKVNGLCARGIVQAMEKGAAWALCFWAKTRMGWREKAELPLRPGAENGGTWEEFLVSYQARKDSNS